MGFQELHLFSPLGGPVAPAGLGAEREGFLCRFGQVFHHAGGGAGGKVRAFLWVCPPVQLQSTRAGVWRGWDGTDGGMLAWWVLLWRQVQPGTPAEVRVWPVLLCSPPHPGPYPRQRPEEGPGQLKRPQTKQWLYAACFIAGLSQLPADGWERKHG